MNLKRWIPTFLAFPLGGLLAVETVGSVDDPVTAAAAGFLAGVVVGAAQWLALRSSGVAPTWIAATGLAMAAGSALAAALTDAGTGRTDVMVAGLVTGAAVGAAQAPLLHVSGRAAAAWVGVSALGWALAWLVTSAVIVDAERGYVVFGSSGALLVTVLTGLALRRLAVRPVAAVAA